MKKSRIAKLALMGASITALAATLTTSTYAWYVSNQKADVTASTGSTASADSDGSISLSTTGEYGTFYKTITLGNFESAGLYPVSTSNGTTFVKITGDDGTNPTTSTATIATAGVDDSATASVYHYQFWVLNSGASSVNIIPSIKVTNTTGAALPTQVNYGTIAGVGAGQQFVMNALNVLTLTSTSTPAANNVTYAADYSWSGGTTSGVTGNVLSGVNTANGTTTLGRITTVNQNNHTGVTTQPAGGARAYYEAISELDLTEALEKPFTPAAAIGNVTIPSLAPVRLDYYLFIDGADDQCFNACENQTFTVEFSYQVAANNQNNG